MELSSITIENFKCFKSKTKIDLSKLTLLTGPNSSGKSSIIYSLLGSIQSGEFPFQFSTNGKYVNMGDFKEIVYNHHRKDKIKISYSFKGGAISKIDTVWVEDVSNNLPKLFSLNVKAVYFNLLITAKNDKFSVDFDYDPEKDPVAKYLSADFYKKINTLLSESIKIDRKESKSKKAKKANNGENEDTASDFFEETNSKQNVKGLILNEVPFFQPRIAEKGSYKLKQIIDLILKVFTDFDDSINFISSFRLHPDRTYLEQTKSKLKVNNYGDGYLDQIIYWETKDKRKFDELIKVVKELNLLESIKSKRLEGGRYEISVQVKSGGIHASLSDVGFGISQFLPVIVADLQLDDKSTLFVAQPEIHLHPSIQSSFGDYLISQIKDKSKKYIIETHSEYLINKIRLAIVKGEIAEKDVNVLFIDGQKETDKLSKIVFNKNGEILNAPESFFTTYMIDVMQIAIHAADR